MAATSTLPQAFTRYREALSGALHEAVGQGDLPLYQMVRYHLGWEDPQGRPTSQEGKRVRPTLSLLACEAITGDYRPALPVAVAVELAHNFSLVHDDVQDGDEERHHRPTVWRLWGKAQAINVGDVLFAMALQSLEGLPQHRRAHATSVLLEKIRLMVEGQHLDLSFEERNDVSVEEYLRMISLKTGAMLAGSTRLGAIAAGAAPQAEEALDAWGLQVGLVFQMVDDVLGIWGDNAETGKSSTNDIARRKKSLPVVHALQHAGPEDRARLLSIYGNGEVDGEGVAAVTAILDRAGSREYALHVANEAHRRAAASLERAGIRGEGRGELQAVADFVLRRTF